jgi:hypothetical protein
MTTKPHPATILKMPPSKIIPQIDSPSQVVDMYQLVRYQSEVQVPMLLVGMVILLSCGIAEAGVIGFVPVSDFAIAKPLWHVVLLVVMVVSMFF